MIDPTKNYVENGYEFDETSSEWKAACAALPCFEELHWPDYATAVFDVNIDGKDLVIQLWKGWCPRFLNDPEFPGGIGGEVGVYERVDGKGFPADRPDFFPELMWDALHLMSERAGGHFFWPVEEKYAIEFDFINPVTNKVMFHAGTENGYWLTKWMGDESYKKYKNDQELRWPWLPGWVPFNSLTPPFAVDYRMEYKINGKPYQPW